MELSCGTAPPQTGRHQAFTSPIRIFNVERS